jgi:N6-L-threonylcarbamoyladenine synthase
MFILGIETSCDETAASVAECGNGEVNIISNIVSSQIEIHKKYGGVVPEMAAREHVLSILPVVNEALAKAGIDRKKGMENKLGAIAATVGPGLITSLLTGIETAKALAYAWQTPLIAVNHIEAHIYSNFIGKNNIEFPAVILTVSGGHTLLALMKGHDDIEKIGETRDDAAGEAFDKAAQLLNLGYPGGPLISKEAAKRNGSQIEDNKSPIKLPRPMISSPNFDFSFSGLKTALLYELKKDKFWNKRVPEYAAEFQQAVIDVLVSKTIRAAGKYEAKTVLLSGGVAANLELRDQLSSAAKLSGVKFLMPDLKYTTDNAAMVAAAGYYKFLKKKFTGFNEIKVDCNLNI